MKTIVLILLLSLNAGLAISAVLAFSGCSSAPYSKEDPSAVYQDAMDDVENDRYILALDKFRTVKNKFPYSKFSTLSELKIADVYFLQESYAEAAASYETFYELHPTHEKVSYAMYRAGESYLRDSPENIARDQGAIVQGLKTFRMYLRRFPNSPEADEVRNKIISTNNRLADKELYIARFYIREEEFLSAEKRLKKIMDLYPDTNARKKAEKLLPEVSEKAKKDYKEMEERIRKARAHG